MKKRILIPLLLCLSLTLAGCGGQPTGDGTDSGLGDDDSSFGASAEELGVYDGYFEESEDEVRVTCVSGTEGAYTLEGGTLSFTELGEDSVYSLSGQLLGNIVIDVGDGYKFDLELTGAAIVSTDVNPVTVLSGNEVSLTAKNGYESYIYDMRESVADSEELYSGAVHSEVDLEIKGKGSLTVVSENNNGIHSKDDLEVKNLTLTVLSVDNALKGNDSVRLTGGTTTLIATGGDGIKTSRSDISEKGNQRGTVTVSGGSHTVYAACDGIDAAYDAVVEGEDTVLCIYTDKYSNYSSVVTATSEDCYYIRFTTDAYLYSVKYYNSDSDYRWVNAEYHSTVSGGWSNYYYYSLPRLTDYDKMQFFIYSDESDMGSEEDYLVASDYLEPNTEYDTFALTQRGGQLTYSWTNYTTSINEGFGGMGGPGGPGGFGGMGEGNSDKGEYSTKGIKAANGITVTGGTVSIKSYDDALHANADSTLENGSAAKGYLTVTGGSLSLYSNDDGLHADGTLSISGGEVSVLHSYEGAEGERISITGGSLSLLSTDDGINSTATSGTGIEIGGGSVYIFCSGDGMDSNSRSSYSGIVFSGGRSVIISNSGGNSAIDTEAGYSYTGGAVVAIMPRGGMSSEAEHCSDFSSVATKAQLSLSEGGYLLVTVGDADLTLRSPVSISAYVVVLGDNSASVRTSGSSGADTDSNGVCWE